MLAKWIQKFRSSSRGYFLTLFKPGFSGFVWPGGGFHPLPENNVTIKVGQWNLAHVCTCQKTTPVSNLVAIAQSVTSLWRHNGIIKISLTAISKVLHMFVNQVFICYENFASLFITLFGRLECWLHFNRKIAKSLKKLSNTAAGKTTKIIKILDLFRNADVIKIFR